MAGPGTQFTGPLTTGTNKETYVNQGGTLTPQNLGFAMLRQVATIAANGGSVAVGTTVALPLYSTVTDVIFNVATAWSAASGAVGSAGTAAAGNAAYASGVVQT